MAATTDSTPLQDLGGGDSMAARLARQRQQRSKLRTSNVPQDTGEQLTSAAAAGELQVLRQEVNNSDATITRLQTQLKQSEAEMAEIGQNTARMAEELKAMREKADAKLSAPSVPDVTDADEPMLVSINMPEGSTNPMEGISVRISIGTDRQGSPEAKAEVVTRAAVP